MGNYFSTRLTCSAGLVKVMTAWTKEESLVVVQLGNDVMYFGRDAAADLVSGMEAGEEQVIVEAKDARKFEPGTLTVWGNFGDGEVYVWADGTDIRVTRRVRMDELVKALQDGIKHLDATAHLVTD